MSLTVLVIEDDDSIREVVSLALAAAGYRVVTARHGREALQRVSAEQPSVIVLDLLMPTMDGWEFIRRYRQTPEPHAAVIALSALSSPSLADVDAFLAKPFDLDQLLRLVDKLAQPGFVADESSWVYEHSDG